MRRWWLRAGVSLVAAVALLTIVPLGLVWAAIRHVSPWVWAGSVVVFVAGHALNAMKLHVLLGAGPATALSCLQAHFTGIAANLGLPGVAGGDVVRIAYLAPEVGASRATVAAVIDRLVDGTVLLFIVLLAGSIAGLPVAAAGPRAGGGSRILILGVVAAGLVVAGWLAIRRTRAGSSLRTAAADILRRPGAVVLAMIMSASVQSTFVLMNVRLASEMGVSVGLGPWFLAWTASKLSAVLPISLGGIGVREATLVSVLGAYGAPHDAVLATGLLWDGALVVGSLGGFALVQTLRWRVLA